MNAEPGRQRADARILAPVPSSLLFGTALHNRRATNYNFVQKTASPNLSAAARLERFRIEKQTTWEEVAKLVGLSVSMIHQVRRGVAELSPKALWRLAIAERESGLSGPKSSGADQAKTPITQETARQTVLEFRERACSTRKLSEDLSSYADELERQADRIEQLIPGLKRSKRKP